MANKRRGGKVETPREKAGRMPSRKLFEDGTYDIEEFHEIFIACEDMTEYDPAIKLCGSWKEWSRLKNDWPTFNDYIIEWKEELEIKLRSEAITKIIEHSKGDDSSALSAAKFISSAGWNSRSGAGRPTKAAKSREAKLLAQATAETKAEEERILKVVNGGIE